MEKRKIVIIGAGAAGLMAAKVLKDRGVDFLILESTDHIGGRAHTLKGNPHIEYGPEFLHGQTPLSDELLEKYNIPYYDLQFDYHLYRDGKLEPLPYFWERLCGVLKDIHVMGQDLSFAEYLEKFDQHSKTDQEISRTFVEGFDAADLDNISAKALGNLKDVACDPETRKMRRPLHGYGELIERLTDEIFPNLLLNYQVKEIEWEKDHVRLKGIINKENIPFEYEAEKVLDTVSVGVLKNQIIHPKPQALKDFLEQVEMGQVVKMVAELNPEFFHLFKNHTFPFISSPDLSFTAWWTTTPIHTNTITAWAGGERARKLVAKKETERKKIFIQELAEIARQTPEQIKSWITCIHHYNWSEDPSYLGAYAYPKVVQGEKIKAQITFEDTLYFAGEAFHEELSGTIEGALRTGKDAGERMAG